MNSIKSTITKTYYAHSGKQDDHSDWQTLSSHLSNVAELASSFASFFEAKEIAYITGLLHDLGKYSIDFDKRLHGSRSVDHSTAGAKIIFENNWKDEESKKIAKFIAFCIAGHHTGLSNGSGIGNKISTLKERLALDFGKGIPKLDESWKKQINLPETLSAPNFFNIKREHKSFSNAFFIRMLYSCLVDADFIDTESFYAKLENKIIERGKYPKLIDLKYNFDKYINSLKISTNKKSKDTEEDIRNAKVNDLRNYIYEYAIEQAKNDPGLFSLTVPTGGGKTFTSMGFALEHAIKHNMRRIIYVIPFTSIIEQNAAKFREAFGNLGDDAVLEHHSNFNSDNIKDENTKSKLQLASENWDMPIIVTTSVQFFESLFSHKSSNCRKLHNITGSVIILDEVQTLPLSLLLPIMQTIKELSQNYKCSIVMCTATQPAIQDQHGFYRGLKNVREIAPNPLKLFSELNRNSVIHANIQNDDDLLDKLINNNQILIIVNLRIHARSLYDKSKHIEGVFHLSTLMCAKHRTKILNTIRQRLILNKPCRVISTSLVEAGVDVDFPIVMRAETGLDSIVQSAGRCNREGKRLSKDSFVWIFKAEEKWKPPPQTYFLASIMRSIVRKYKENLLSIEAINDYFLEVYNRKGEELDSENILKQYSRYESSMDFPFESISQDFNMIDNYMQPLIIPFDSEAQSLINKLQHADKIGGILRKLQPYIIQIPKKGFDVLYSKGRIESINQQFFKDQFYALIGMDLYDNIAGLSWEDADFIKAENLIV